MLELALGLMLQYGVMPVITFYLVNVVTREHRLELQELRRTTEQTTSVLLSNIQDNSKTLLELSVALGKLQTAVTTQVNIMLLQRMSQELQQHD